MDVIVLRRFGMLLIVIAALATACESPTPVAFITPTIQATASATFLRTVTVRPTDTPAPTRTPVTPTATSLPPTATATSTPTNTATTRPTRATSATPRATPVAKPPTATKAAATSAGPVVSSKPTTLEKSVQQSLNAVYAAIGSLDQMKQGGGVELCAPLLTGYQSIRNAPTYDPNGQSVQFQQAYNLYRQAIDLINSRAASFQNCGQGGGAIGGLDWSETRAKLDRAAQLLQQALDWAQRTADPSSLSLSEAVTRARLAAVAIVGAMDRYLDAGSHESCDPIVAEINALKAMPTYDVSAQAAAVQNAYNLYRQAVDLGVAKTVSIVDVCARGGGQIGSLDAYALRQAFRDIYSNLSQALKLLGQ